MRHRASVQAFAITTSWCISAAGAAAENVVDHHQHLISPRALAVFSAPKAITAADLISEIERGRHSACRGSFRCLWVFQHI